MFWNETEDTIDIYSICCEYLELNILMFSEKYMKISFPCSFNENEKKNIFFSKKSVSL